MALTKTEATEIVNAVASDAECLRRIKEGAVVADKLPDAWGINGSIRNWGYVACGMLTLGKGCNPNDAEYAEKVCTGITEATVIAISGAANCRKALVGHIKKVTSISRNGFMGTDHTATEVIMSDGSEYVFDWHATLNPRNPMVHKAADWLRSTGGTVFAKFSGL